METYALREFPENGPIFVVPSNHTSRWLTACTSVALAIMCTGFRTVEFGVGKQIVTVRFAVLIVQLGSMAKLAVLVMLDATGTICALLVYPVADAVMETDPGAGTLVRM